MVFTSTGFWIFFVIVLTLFNLVRPSSRWIILLASSLYFYSMLRAPQLLIALTLVVILTYFIGRRLDNNLLDSGKRKRILLSGILGNLAIMLIIRYAPLLIKSLQKTSDIFNNKPNLLLSIGISFIVFQAISYLVDIYHCQQKAEHHLGFFAIYISYFPKLLQGPIEKSATLLPQLHKPKALTDESIRSAIFLIVWGLFKKLVVADHLGIMVDAVYDHSSTYSGLPLWIATVYYSLQLYCDFSGYTDIAIGAARFFGINLSINFNKPYFSRSIAEFWRRWHISFTKWIFEYLFTPLNWTFRRLKIWAAPIALLITFILSGIWHGASLGFVIWGLLHGIYMASYSLFSPYLNKFLKRLRIENAGIVKVLQVIFTFLSVSFAWIFFRSPSIQDGLFIVSHLFSPSIMNSNLHLPVVDLSTFISMITLKNYSVDFIIALLGLLIIFIVELPKDISKTNLGKSFSQYAVIRWSLFFLLMICIITMGVTNKTEFAYFRF